MGNRKGAPSGRRAAGLRFQRFTIGPVTASRFCHLTAWYGKYIVTLIRAANQKLKLGFGQVSFEKCCKLTEGSGVVLDIDKHLRAFTRFDKVGQARIATEISDMDKSEVPEIRHVIHGHDMIDLLTWYIRQHKGFKKITREIVDRALFGCLEVAALNREKMFQMLLARLTEASGVQINV